jgi:hypothetical protein
VSQNDFVMHRRRGQGGSPLRELEAALKRTPGASDLLDRVRRSDAMPRGARPPQSEQALRADSVHTCRVETVLADRFSAIFTLGNTDKRVRFMRKLVAPSDRPLLREGAIFYWVRGTGRGADGDVETKSYIRFKRTTRISTQELDEINRMAIEAIRAGGGSPNGIDDLV